MKFKKYTRMLLLQKHLSKPDRCFSTNSLSLQNVNRYFLYKRFSRDLLPASIHVVIVTLHKKILFSLPTTVVEFIEKLSQIIYLHLVKYSSSFRYFSIFSILKCLFNILNLLRGKPSS